MLGRDAYPKDAAKLAAFLYFVAKSHMCWTGAKRITLALTMALLGHNGCWLRASASEMEVLITGIAASMPRVMYATMNRTESWAALRMEC